MISLKNSKKKKIFLNLFTLSFSKDNIFIKYKIDSTHLYVKQHYYIFIKVTFNVFKVLSRINPVLLAFLFTIKLQKHQCYFHAILRFYFKYQEIDFLMPQVKVNSA